MAQKYDNTNRGVLFTNDRKQKDNSPDYTGNINVAGKEWFLSAWNKQSKGGKSFISLSVSEPRERTGGAPQSENKNDKDEDTPF